MGIEGFGRSETRTQPENVSDFSSNVEVLKPQIGATTIRILPVYKKDGEFFKKISKHYIYNAFERSVFESLCPAAMPELGGVCAICEKGEELYNSRDEVAMEFAGEKLRPREYILYNVVCYNGPANKRGEVPRFGKVYVFETGKQVHGQVLELDNDEGQGWADVTNINNGVNLTVKRIGEGKTGTKYIVSPHGSGRTDVAVDLQSQGHDPMKLELHDLDRVYPLPDAKALEAAAAKIKVPTGTVTETEAPLFAPAQATSAQATSAQATSAQATSPVHSATQVASPLIPAPPAPPTQE